MDNFLEEREKTDASNWKFSSPNKASSNNLSKEEALKCKHSWVYGGGVMWCKNCGWFKQPKSDLHPKGAITKSPGGRGKEILEGFNMGMPSYQQLQPKKERKYILIEDAPKELQEIIKLLKDEVRNGIKRMSGIESEDIKKLLVDAEYSFQLNNAIGITKETIFKVDIFKVVPIKENYFASMDLYYPTNKSGIDYDKKSITPGEDGEYDSYEVLIDNQVRGIADTIYHNILNKYPGYTCGSKYSSIMVDFPTDIAKSLWGDPSTKDLPTTPTKISMNEDVTKFNRYLDLVYESIEITQDIFDYYEFYSNMDIDTFFSERSHGLLRFSFRSGFNIKDGHQVKIIFDLGSAENVEVKNDYINMTGGTPDRMYKTTRGEIQRQGHNDFTANAKVKAIVDMDSMKRLQEVQAFGIFGDMSEGIAMPRDLKEEIRNLTGRRTSSFYEIPLPLREKIIQDSKFRKAVTDIADLFEVGKMFKSRNVYMTTNGNFKTGYDIETRERLGYQRGHKGAIKSGIKESVESTECNTDLSEAQAKKTIGTLSANIIDDGKKITQYTANIYSNIITKNLMEVWSKDFKKFTIILGDTKSDTVEFVTPKMSQDFVARFIAGHESISKFLRRSNEIKLRISPKVLQEMKERDDAFYFFKAAVKYYDSQVNGYATRIMSEVMKFGHNMKHLISHSKLSGLVTYPLSLLFTFDNVNISDRNTFKIETGDIDAVNRFIKNIATSYASPEKEKKQIIEDVKDLVKELREYVENIGDIAYLPEAIEDYISGEFDEMILEASRLFIEGQIDYNYKPNVELKQIYESFGVKKLKKIPRDLVAYIQIETESIKDSNDKMMISSYCLGKLEIVEWYIELLEVGSKKYIVPHNRPYLEMIRTQLLACFKQIMDVKITNSTNRPIIDIKYPKGYEG